MNLFTADILPFKPASLRGDTWLHGNYCCFDVETLGVDVTDPDNALLCVAWQSNDNVMHSEYLGKSRCLPERFIEAIGKADFLIAHNAKFEGHWLAICGDVQTDRLWADPMLMEWVLLGSNPNRWSLSLDETAQRYGYAAKDTLVQTMFDAGCDIATIPDVWLLERCRNDVTMTLQIFRRQLKLLEQRKLLHIAVSRCIFSSVLVEIERNRIFLDAAMVEDLHGKATLELHAAKQHQLQLIGREVNERSPNEMIPLVYGLYPAQKPEKGEVPAEEDKIESLGFKEIADRRGNPKRGKTSSSWPEGRPMLNKHVLEDLKKQAKTPKQKQWIANREHISQRASLLSKNLDFFLGVCRERGRAFCAEIMLGITATHRTSGRGRPLTFADGKTRSVQSQNMPRELKKLQVPSHDDYLVFDLDGSQLEFRAAAFLCNDPIAKADIADKGFDAHIQTLAVKLHGCFDIDVYRALFKRYKAGDQEVKKQRADNTLTKADTFKPLFGGTSGSKLQVAYYEFFNNKYSAIAQAQAGWLRELSATGKIKSCTGMEFTWLLGSRADGTIINRSTGKPIKPSAYNYPIQYFGGAELIPISIIYLYYMTRHLRVRLNNTVHDSVVGEVHKDDVQEFLRLAAQAFTEVPYHHLLTYYGIDYDVPIAAECTLGDHVGQGKSVVFERLRGNQI